MPAALNPSDTSLSPAFDREALLSGSSKPRTIDLHGVCDDEHGASLGRLITARPCDPGGDSFHSIKRGAVRGMIASERLYSDIHRGLS